MMSSDYGLIVQEIKDEMTLDDAVCVLYDS